MNDCVITLRSLLIPPEFRFRAVELLKETSALTYAQELDEHICAWSGNKTLEYLDKCSQLSYNMRITPRLAQEYNPASLISLSDEQLAKGTMVENVHKNDKKHRDYIQAVLKNYESMSSLQEMAPLRCRQCGSADIQWEQKQTRGADEAMTVFCSCTKCQLRWKMS
jgi:DNA-directed RNA polymerase subunit M/transcription elongation factor TFIIS